MHDTHICEVVPGFSSGKEETVLLGVVAVSIIPAAGKLGEVELL